MPCDSINRTTVEIGKLDPLLLGKAMAELGLAGRYTHNTARGTVDIRGSSSVTQAEIKQAYSAQVVQATAKKYGWQIKAVGKFQYEVTKR